MNSRLAILGAGGHGKVVADAALLTDKWSTIAFFDDAYPNKTNNGRWDILGTSDDLLSSSHQYSGIIIAIGNNHLRLSKTIEFLNKNLPIVSVIHPAAIVSPFATIETGSVIFAGAAINVDARIGRSCIINTNSVVEHDCHLHDGVHLSPNAALGGQTVVGKCSWIGIGAVTKQLVYIGQDVTIGAGSTVVKPIPDGATAIGNPATAIK